MTGTNSKSRRAFTVIELLIVITVIGLMLSLLVGASFRFVAGARESATNATITKINGIIQDRVTGFRNFDFSAESSAAAAVLSLPSVGGPELADILVRKVRFKRAFPQSFSELDTQQISRFFPGQTIPPASFAAKYENSIVLYAFLTKGETFGAPTPGVDAFTAAEVKNNADTGNLPCLVDAWGEPIRFYRWPTRLLRCGEQDFDGNAPTDKSGNKYYDLNQNGQQDSLGYPVYPSAPSAVAPGFLCPIGRPNTGIYAGPTPTTLLIRNLPGFDRNSTFAAGADGLPGIALIDDDGINGIDDVGELGWPNSDDPEFLNTDPDDPTFRLWDWLFVFNAAKIATNQQPSSPQAKNYFQFVNFDSSISTNVAVQYMAFNSYKHDCCTFHTPLIVSAGPDKRLGLYEPTDITNFGYLASPEAPPSGFTYATWTMQNLMDNITNLNQRAGGK